MGSSGGDELSEWETQSSATANSHAHEEKIQVSVRVRPLTGKEIATNDFADWECVNSTTIVYKNTLGERTTNPNAYMYDRVFGPDSSTREVYHEAAKEVALNVVNGINSSIFAYGQTSSGKTFTMVGITQYTIEDIFNHIEEHNEREFVLKFSALEIYNEAVRDLLSEDTNPLRLLDDPERGTVVERLTEETLKDKSHLLELMAVCEAQRQIGETSLNETSSRSHQILRLTVESSVRQLVGAANISTLSAIVNFVDLAGSERSSQSVGTRLKEGCHINRSLLTLGTVIRKLSKGRNGHVPFRDSKLTRILQHSLGGNARTAIICTMSPAHRHVEQSRNTLLFATCAKEVGTNAKVNVVMSDKALVKQLRKELARLADELKYMSLAPSKVDSSAELREKELQIEEMSKEIKELSYQRDLAQARIEELLLSTGQEEEASRKLDQSRRLLMEHQRKISWLDDSFVGSDYQHLDTNLKTSKSLNHLREQNTVDHNNHNSDLRDNYNNNNIDLRDNSEDQFCTDDSSQQLPDKSPEFSEPDQGYGNFIHKTHGDTDDNCKEVRCIEVEKVSIEKEFDIVPSKKSDMEPTPSATEYNALVNRIRELQSTIDSLVTQSPADNLPLLTESEMSSARGLSLFRSRSCKAAIASSQRNDHSGQKLEIQFDGRLSGRPKSFPMPSILNNSDSVNSPRINLTSIRDALLFTDLDQDQKLEKSQKDELNVEQGTLVSPSIQLQDFELQQKKLITLWDSCHTSIVHRSYFFLLFTGSDPSHLMYMEVELRRLSFIQTKFSQGESITMDGQILTPSSSIRAINQEREMLSRQMNRKFAAKEKEALFRKWDIGVDTKRRRIQLARRLWTNPNDMEHVRDSAELVAKLCGFTNEGRVPKEMFVGPNFASKAMCKKSFSWRDSFTL